MDSDNLPEPIYCEIASTNNKTSSVEWKYLKYVWKTEMIIAEYSYKLLKAISVFSKILVNVGVIVFSILLIKWISIVGKTTNERRLMLFAVKIIHHILNTVYLVQIICVCLCCIHIYVCVLWCAFNKQNNKHWLIVTKLSLTSGSFLFIHSLFIIDPSKWYLQQKTHKLNQVFGCSRNCSAMYAIKIYAILI